MHILITGANGFVGSSLTRYLIMAGNLNGHEYQRITLMDLNFDTEIQHLAENHKEISLIRGSFAEAELLESACADQPFDYIFHLASVPSSLSETNHALGIDANVYGMITLLDHLRQQGNTPILVFASSIATFGKPLGTQVTEDTTPTPNLSYGFQKLIGENLVGDYIHKKWVNACSLRLPGIVARPPIDNGAGSIFFSDIIRKLCAGEKTICPVSPDASSWLMSIQCCIENLLHGAQLCENKQISHLRSTFTLPPLHLSIAELVNAIADHTGNSAVKELIDYQPDEWTQTNFGSYPPILCPNAFKAGFTSDDSLTSLVKKSLF